MEIKKTVKRWIFDLKTFAAMQVAKEVTIAPVTSWEDFLASVGNDTAKGLELLNRARAYAVKADAKKDADGWFTVNEETGIIGEKYEGTAADEKKVNALTLTMAKTMFGYAPKATKEAKQTAREKAEAQVKKMFDMGILQADQFALAGDDEDED